MTTTPLTSTGGNQVPGQQKALTTDDFIKMMMTQLQNQDPLQPTKNEDLLAQMSQIGQLQSSTELQSSLKSLVLQNNIGSASNLIGKTVQGLDENGKPIGGLVNSIRVEDGQVSLNLDSGKALSMSNVISITTTPTAVVAK